MFFFFHKATLDRMLGLGNPLGALGRKQQIESVATDPPEEPSNTLKELSWKSQQTVTLPPPLKKAPAKTPPVPEKPLTDSTINSAWSAVDRAGYHRSGYAGARKGTKKRDEMMKLKSEEYAKKMDLTTRNTPGVPYVSKDRDVLTERTKEYQNYYKAAAEAHNQMSSESSTDASISGLGASKTTFIVVIVILIAGVGFYFYSRR